MKAHALSIFLVLAITGCNNLNDLRPTDPYPEIPEATVKTVKDKFPKAEELVFKPVLEEKIWEVKLKSGADRYTSLVDYGKMWETFKVSPNGIPSALAESLAKTAFKDGTLSAHSTAYFATTTSNKLIYNYKGENYSFEWTGLTSNSNSSATFDRFLYRVTTYEIGDLPAAARDTIQSRPGMTFVSGSIWVGLDETKRYYVVANQKNVDRTDRISMIFDANGKLQWSGTDYFKTGAPDSSWQLETVPAEIEQYVAGVPELAGSQYESKRIHSVRGRLSYYFVLRVDSVSWCELYFDQNFSMLHKKYSVRLN